jgi:hypothetical protein
MTIIKPQSVLHLKAKGHFVIWPSYPRVLSVDMQRSRSHLFIPPEEVICPLSVEVYPIQNQIINNVQSAFARPSHLQ